MKNQLFDICFKYLIKGILNITIFLAKSILEIVQ